MIPEMIGLLAVEQASGKTEKVFIPRGGIIQAGREPKIGSQLTNLILMSLGRERETEGAIQIILEDRVPHICMEFTVKGAEAFVTDLCSKAGLLRLNGAKLVGFRETRLKSGDVIEIGHTRITFQEIAQ